MNYIDYMINECGEEIAMIYIEELIEWRDVENYEGLYLVSEWGDVMSIGHGKKRILKPVMSDRGYLRVCLVRNGEHRMHSVHRLVATAFCEGAGEFESINHLDEDKTNNCYENLEWCTHEYNANYGTRNERISETKKIRVRCIELDMIFDSGEDAAEYVGGHKSAISYCCNGKRNTHKGYTWEFVN